MNKLNIFQTSCDLNDKYDTAGFADMIDKMKVEDSMTEFEEAAADKGGSIQAYSVMTMYDFHPVDVFAKPIIDLPNEN